MDPLGQITLLGDAVHAMPPDRGIGVTNVFEDARVLASILATEKGESNLSQLIGDYEHSMLMRAKKEVAHLIRLLKSITCKVFGVFNYEIWH